MKTNPKELEQVDHRIWHFMNEFVDKDGTVYHKGKEMPELKGTRPITVIKPKKKTKRRTQEQILLDRQKEKKAA